MSTWGGTFGTTLRLYDPTGHLYEIPVVSADAVLRVLGTHAVKNLRSGEPFFVLRGQDATAAATVRQWAHTNRQSLDGSKYLDALQIADEMERWPSRRSPT